MKNKVISKKDLIYQIRGSYPFYATDIELIINAFFKQIEKALVDGNNVSINNFGTFKVGKIRSRTWHRPNSTEILQLPETKVVNFVCSKKLKGVINEESIF